MTNNLMRALQIAIKVLEGDKSFRLQEMYNAKVELMAFLARELAK
jgi:hypothetical protein